MNALTSGFVVSMDSDCLIVLTELKQMNRNVRRLCSLVFYRNFKMFVSTDTLSEKEMVADHNCSHEISNSSSSCQE